MIVYKDVIPLLTLIVPVFLLVAVFVRIEHRFTKLEDRLDLLMNSCPLCQQHSVQNTP